MPGNAGLGRPKGSRNKRTAELLALVGDGETPVEFGLRIMRDEAASLDQRLWAARFAAPYLHARPVPIAEDAGFELPEAHTREGIAEAASAVLRAVADGTITARDGRDLATLLEFKSRSVELLADERRYDKVMRKQPAGTDLS